MTLKEMPKVGEKVRYTGNSEEYRDYVTKGKIYEVYTASHDQFSIVDDDDDVNNKLYVRTKHFDLFELVTEISDETPVEASPTVIELLANLSRRLYEAENEITELNAKQAEFLDIGKLLANRLFEVERQNAQQAYEINELYKAVSR